jgi:hypothetical protein
MPRPYQSRDREGAVQKNQQALRIKGENFIDTT